MARGQLVRLKQQLLADEGRTWPMPGFTELRRHKERHPWHKVRAADISALLAGEPTSASALELLLSWLRDQRISLSAEEISNPVEGMHTDTGRPSPLLTDASRIVGQIKSEMERSPTLPHEAYCRTDEDRQYATELIFKKMGHCIGDLRLTDTQALKLARQRLPIRFDTVVACLKRWTEANPHAVLFATHPLRGGRVERIGVVGCVPLTKDAYCRFARGQCDEFTFPASDLCRTSNHIALHVLADDTTKEVSRFTRGIKSLHALLMSIGSLSHRRSHPDSRVSLVTIASAPHLEQALTNFAFRPNGHKTPTTGYPLVELTSPAPEGASCSERAIRYLGVSIIHSVIEAYRLLLVQDRK
jgi:hypothetical protein